MIAVRVAPDMRMAVVGSPLYFRNRSEPNKPQDLIGHNCIGLRLRPHGGLYAWEFEKDGRELRVRVDGQFVAFGPGYLPAGMAQPISPAAASNACSATGCSRFHRGGAPEPRS